MPERALLQTPPSYGPFSVLEMSFIKEAAEEREMSISALIRAAVFNDLYR